MTKLTTVLASDKTWYKLDLQEAYDQEVKAYPQAVMLIKEDLLASYPDLASTIGQSFEDNINWVKENPKDAVNAVNGVLSEGATPSLAPAVITSEVVENCKIYWESAEDGKKAVKSYIDSIIKINEQSAKKVENDFFYDGKAQGQFEGDNITVVAPDGAPALAISKFIFDKQDFGTEKTFNYKVVTADKIGGAVSQGTGDIVIIPINAASKLYSVKGYKMVSVVTHGNLYIVSSEEINSITDLKDKTIGVIGQGLVPDLTFKVVLDKFDMTSNIAD